MLNIQMSPAQKMHINRADSSVLKDVIEAEVKKAEAVLKETASADSFRYHQGVIQALEAVHKLLS